MSLNKGLTPKSYQDKSRTQGERGNRGFGRLIKPSHKRVSRALGYALTLLDENSMWVLAALLHARLTPRERAFVALSALMALDDDEYQSVIDHVEGTA